MAGLRGLMFGGFGVAMTWCAVSGETDTVRESFLGFWRDVFGRENLRHVTVVAACIVIVVLALLVGHRWGWWS